MTDFLTGYVLQAGAGLGDDPGLKATRHLTGAALSVLETSIDAGPLHVDDRGWRIEYLGTSTPVEELERAADASHPDLVVLAATTQKIIEPLRAELASLARRAPLCPCRGRRHAGDRERAGSPADGRRPVTEAERTGWPR